MKVYVASSWRNNYQPGVVSALRKNGHDVYDFRKDGFSWNEIDPNWREWTPKEYIAALSHSCALRGFQRDMQALVDCQACVMVIPCGPSASMEMGWAKGAGKPVTVYVPEVTEKNIDLMVMMADLVTDDLNEIIDLLAFRFVKATQVKGILG